jgi:exopolysaccharide biosynthesis polyprenyl glycosylphosphotransferase
VTLADESPTTSTDVVPAPVPAVSWPERIRGRGVDRWQRQYLRHVVLVDLAVILGSSFLALHIRFGASENSVTGISYEVLTLLLVPVWIAALAIARAYEARYIGTGAEEFKRVGSASLRLMAVIAVISFTFKLELARGYVAIALPVGTVLLLVGRYGNRRLLHNRRNHGHYLRRVIAVGGVDGIRELADQLQAEPYVGYTIVGACLPTPSESFALPDIPVMGSLSQVMAAVAEVDADTVAVGIGPGMSPEVLRSLSWELEGTGIALVVAPGLLDVAGPRISVKPVAGLPLLHVDEPELSGLRQATKATVEWLFAFLACVVTLPVIAILMLAVRLDSDGPALFTQTRVGKNGREFTVYKMRTMRNDAESLLESLREHNEAADGLLFKMKDDPRITLVGGFLRKWSLDELPQLWNVVRGDMALVGPRPPLPTEVAQYGPEVARRLLVRPGITGLWQVSGRSNLCWDDSVRLDLYYVENWSLALDAMIVWKTFFAIFRKEGAY